ncbi:MAG: hypothetical protein PHW34_04890 [Hespellia sp.]|nr:hypothetical protein [Hespellia sp.]
MKRVVGFAMVFLALGMILSCILPSGIIEILVIAGLLILGYNLFCY